MLRWPIFARQLHLLGEVHCEAVRLSVIAKPYLLERLALFPISVSAGGIVRSSTYDLFLHIAVMYIKRHCAQAKVM